MLYPLARKAEIMEFTPEMARTMNADEIATFWRQRQIAQRDAGQPHYTELLRADTGETVCTIMTPTH